VREKRIADAVDGPAPLLPQEWTHPERNVCGDIPGAAPLAEILVPVDRSEDGLSGDPSDPVTHDYKVCVSSRMRNDSAPRHAPPLISAHGAR
jgi:hypothetical protein